MVKKSLKEAKKELFQKFDHTKAKRLSFEAKKW